jgi:hypothetical protein
MAKRGKKATEIDAPTDRDQKYIRQLLRKAGSHRRLIEWINDTTLPEDFIKDILPGLAAMEKQFWQHERSPETRRLAGRPLPSLHPNKRVQPITREEIVRMEVAAMWPHRKKWGFGHQTQTSVVKRIIRDLRRYKAAQ